MAQRHTTDWKRSWPSKTQDRILEPSPARPNAVPDLIDRLKTALADRYAIEREIGAGGMATVYLAEDLKLHRKVALMGRHET